MPQRPLANPYVAGRVIHDPELIFGRRKVLTFVETEIGKHGHQLVVLAGPRRIGKTSSLIYLQTMLPKDMYLPVFFDLLDRTTDSLEVLLSDLADTMEDSFGMERSGHSFEAGEDEFLRRFLSPLLDRQLLPGQTLVLLLDEFDVLDREPMNPSASSRSFFSSLRRLLEKEHRLAAVVTIGRKTEDLSIATHALLKAAPAERISVLDTESARQLILLAEKQGIATFDRRAVDAILDVTAGHPYLIQMICQLAITMVSSESHAGTPVISEELVRSLVPDVLVKSDNVFRWLWDGLSSVDRFVMAAIAELTEGHDTASEEQVISALRSAGIDVAVGDFNSAPERLADWGLLRKVGSRYQLEVEMIRRWIRRSTALSLLGSEALREAPLADTLVATGKRYLERGDVEQARTQVDKALAINPLHVKGRLLLAKLCSKSGDLESAIKVLRDLQLVSESAGRAELLELLLELAKRHEADEQLEAAIDAYGQVCELSPLHRVAARNMKRIWELKGDRAAKAGENELALMAYANAGAEEKAKAIRAGEHQEKVKALESEAKVADRSGDFARAIRVYRQLQELEPEDEGYRQMELGAEREMLRRRVHRALVSGYDEAALEDLERLAELDKRGAWKSLLHHVRLRSTMARARAYHELGEDEKIDELVTNLRSMGYSAVETEAVEAERTKGEGRVKLREAAERLIAGDVRNARRLTAEALSKDPGDRRLTRDAATLLQYSTGVRSELARRPFLSIFRIIPLLVACFAICLLGTRASGSLGNLDIATFLLGGLLLIVTKTAVLANGPTTLIYAIFVFSTLLLVGLWILLWLQEALQWLLWRGRNTSVPAANSEEEGRSRA